MSVELIVEVLLHAPATLTPAEKLLLTVIAESCNTSTRSTWYRSRWDAEEVARRAHLTVGSLSKTFWSLAQKGCEVRVAHGTDKHGKPIFAHKGKQTTFKLPRFAPKRVDESLGIDSQRSDEDRTFTDGVAAKGPTYVGVRSDEDRGFEGQRSDEDRTLLLKDLPSKNTSSLSPREDEPPPAPTVPAQRTERENDDASQKPKNDKPTGTTGILLGAGLTLDEANSFTGWADQLPGGPKGGGWYLTLQRNGTLQERIEEWRASGTVVPSCSVCDDEGEVGDWMNRRNCDCIWWKDRGAAQKAFVAQLKDFPDCTHGVAGGGLEAPNGWRYCSLCRGRDWVEMDLRPRTGNQGGGYIAQVSRSPADQRLAEGAQLYAKYKARESAGHKPWQNYADPSVYDEDWPTT